MAKGYTHLNDTEQRILARMRDLGYSNKDVQQVL